MQVPTLLPLLMTDVGVKGSSVPVCACVSIRSITKKRMIPKPSNLVQGMNLGYPISDMIFTSKGQRSR